VSSTTSKVPKTPGSLRPSEDLSAVMGALRGRGEAMPPALAVLVAREVARALHHAQTHPPPDAPHGVAAHREVTPTNVLLLKAGGVKLLAARGSGSKAPPGDAAYRAPEVVRGAPADHRSDIFSLGAVLWEMVAGQRLFGGETESDILQNVLMQPIAEPSRRRDGIPATLDAIVARALDREPANRYESAEALAADLDRFLVDAPVADQAIPQLLDDLFTAPVPPKRDDARDDWSGPTSGSGPTAAPRPKSTARTSRIYRTMPPPQPPRIPLPALIGIFLIVTAVVVTVGRVVIRHHAPANQSSSAKSVSTSK